MEVAGTSYEMAWYHIQEVHLVVVPTAWVKDVLLCHNGVTFCITEHITLQHTKPHVQKKCCRNFQQWQCLCNQMNNDMQVNMDQKLLRKNQTGNNLQNLAYKFLCNKMVTSQQHAQWTKHFTSHVIYRLFREQGILLSMKRLILIHS